MVRKTRNKSPRIKLREPDRSGPTEQTLLQLAEERGLFEQALKKEKANKRRRASQSEDRDSEEDVGGDGDTDGPALSPTAERILDTFLWTASLAMLHFTLDVLVQHQYAIALNWPAVWRRAGGAFLVFGLLFYTLHAHAASPTLVPGLPARVQHPLRQSVFFAASVVAGCYLVYITNTFGYYAVMKQAPPLGCVWVWSVIELELLPAVLSVACTGLFLWRGGYSIK